MRCLISLSHPWFIQLLYLFTRFICICDTVSMYNLQAIIMTLSNSFWKKIPRIILEEYFRLIGWWRANPFAWFYAGRRCWLVPCPGDPGTNDGPDRHCCHGYFIGRNVQPYDLNLTIHVQLFSIGVQYFYYLFNFLLLLFIYYHLDS